MIIIIIIIIVVVIIIIITIIIIIIIINLCTVYKHSQDYAQLESISFHTFSVLQA